jgi:hypothetical protein
LRSLSEKYYTKTKPTAADKKYPTALAAIEEACRLKPNGQHPIGQIRIRAAPHARVGSKTTGLSVAVCMHEYPFSKINRSDPSDDADMLLTGPATDISFRYFFLHRYSLIHAPHLFEGDSPLLLLALVFQKAETVKTLLAVAGVDFDNKDLDTLIAQNMATYQAQSGTTGWTEAFEELRETMRSRWHPNTVKDYKGYGKPGSYRHTCVKE